MSNTTKRSHHLTRRNLCFILAGLLMIPTAVSSAVTNKDCFECHADKQLLGTNAQGKAVSMFLDEAKFKASTHRDQACVDCHVDIKDLPHAEKLLPVRCAECHADTVKLHKASIHGQAVQNGVAQAAHCADCHGAPHEMLSSVNTNSLTFFANIPRLCGACHGNDKAMAQFNLLKNSTVTAYEHSVHGLAWASGTTNRVAVCTDCHGAHDIADSSNSSAKLFWQNIPATCGKCHGAIQKPFDRSVHGKAVRANHRDAPVCTDCHREHDIVGVKKTESSVSFAHIQETCSQCHKAERIASRYGFPTNVVETYVQSYHGLAASAGGIAAANCASCHGFHDILPSSDPASSVNKANLPTTCGKCHPAIGTRLAAGDLKIHQSIGTGQTPQAFAVMLVTQIYIVLIIVVVGGMALFNLLDWISKVRAHICAVRANPGEMRLTRIARFQHITLVIAFILLVYTGFVHKFPDAWWSWPIRAIPDGSYVRGLIHRLAGWVFTGVFGLHLVLLVGTARGRAYLQHLAPRGHDVLDFWVRFKGYLRLHAPHHTYRRFNFVEKAEYWALVWGSVVMIVTGIMLIFTESVLRFLPKVWLDLAQVIHLYEAVLATLAIVIWHFYWVIFDPHEYPMNPAWLVGRKARPTDTHVDVDTRPPGV